MRALRFWCGLFVIALALREVAPASDANGESKEVLPPFDVDRLLNGPDHRDFRWQVSASMPALTLQQRYLVTINATIYGGRRFPSSKSERDLYFVLKVATADNHWVADSSCTRIPVPARLGSSQAVAFTDKVYLRPGRYTVALIVYDPTLKKENVWRRHIEVPRMKKDPLPEIDRDLPEVEFITYDIRLPLPLAKGKEWLPVKNTRALCIDIVANTSVDYDNNPRLGSGSMGTSLRWYNGRGQYKAHANSMEILRVSSVLSHLQLSKGKIRVSILDTLRMKTLFDREDAQSFDWQGLGKVVLQQNYYTIAKDLFGSQTEASNYLLAKLSKILEGDTCAAEGEAPLRIVIVVSSEIRFAKNTIIRQIAPQDPASARVIYFPLSNYMKDDLLSMLKPTKPRVYASQSRPFRWMLADLISYFEKIK